jgi:hypothetical protein
MPTPVQTLWIVTAATLPTVGLVVLLTPKAPTLLSAESIQPAVMSHAESLLNQRNLAIAQSLPPEVKPPASKAELSLKKPSTASPGQAVVIPSSASSKAFNPTTRSPVRSQTARTLPSPSVAAQTPPSFTSGQVSEDSSRVVPFRNPKPQPTSPSNSTVQIPPAQRLRQQPIARTTPSSSKTPSPQPSLAALPTPSMASSPEGEPSREEVESLCKKFPLNSRCQSNTVAQGASSPTSSNAPSPQASPEPEPSREEVESLCQKFPLNSRCRNNTVARGASSPTSSNTPSSQASPEPEPSREEVESLCQKFPLNSRCQSNTTQANP